MLFPSRVVVYRSQGDVTVLNHYGSGEHWGCRTNSERKASEWTWQNVERAAKAGSLLANMALLERACDELCSALSTKPSS